MSERKKNKSTQTVPESFTLAEEIKPLVKDLYYISETDAEVLPYVGVPAAEVSAAEILKQTGKAADTAVEERDFNEIFDRLTKIQDWFGEEEKATAAKFAALKKLLEENLRDLKVFKVGTIQLDIYIVGLPAENILAGVQTKAVET